MGYVSEEAGLEELVVFGKCCERNEFPHIAVGGFIDFGLGFATNALPGKELYREPTRQEAGPSTRPWQRSRKEAKATTSGTTTHAQQRWLRHLGLEEMSDYYPDLGVNDSSSGLLSISIDVGLFRTLPHRGLLVLDVSPAENPDRAVIDLPRDRLVPDVRAWAFWSDGTLARSHHANPDLSICSCLPGEWILGIHGLLDYVSYCTCWLAKVLFDSLIGYWPGPQHFGPRARRMRGKVDEYCGCGSLLRYRTCCRASDLLLSDYELWLDSWRGEQMYLRELEGQGRPRFPAFLGKPPRQ